MRKTIPLPSTRFYVGKAAKPVFLTERPTFRTRLDWSRLLLDLGLFAVVAAAGFGIAALVLL